LNPKCSAEVLKAKKLAAGAVAGLA
jgi:hypothetical protein